MRAIKILSIIGIAFAVVCFICMMIADSMYDYAAAEGWGMYAMLYLITLSIVVLASKDKKVPNEKQKSELV